MIHPILFIRVTKSLLNTEIREHNGNSSALVNVLQTPFIAKGIIVLATILKTRPEDSKVQSILRECCASVSLGFDFANSIGR